MRKRLGQLMPALALMMGACDSPTGLAGDLRVVATSAERYVATATALPATIGFLTRYDFDVPVKVQNLSDAPMILERCEGQLLAIVSGGGPSLLDEEAAQRSMEAERGLCDSVDHVALLPGESMLHHARFWGFSSSPAFMSAMDKSYQVIVSDRGRALWSAPFTIHLPED